jgi:transposase
MGKLKTTEKEILEIIKLRRKGLSLDSIHKIIPRGKTTIYSYIKNVKVDFNLKGTGIRLN